MQRIAPPKDHHEKFLLDLGCGDRKSPGYIGIDIAGTDAADYTFDLTSRPWPIDDGVVDGIVCNHFFEHLNGLQRITFMDECYRILKPRAQLVVVVPYWSSMRAIQDPTHQWPPVCEASFYYFNQVWREQNRLRHYDIRCNFEFTFGYVLDEDLHERDAQWQRFALRHYLQAVNDLHVTLTRLV